MKEYHVKHKHYTQDGSLGNLLDRCGHYMAHRIGGKKRGQEGILSVIAGHPGITQKERTKAITKENIKVIAMESARFMAIAVPNFPPAVWPICWPSVVIGSSTVAMNPCLPH